MPVSIGRKPESDFNDPLGMMSDCHRRIERFLNALSSVAKQARGAQLSAMDKEVLQVSLRYFSMAAPNHTGDEEGSLFPRLLLSNNQKVKDIIAKVESLIADHNRADTYHKEVEFIVNKWLNEGSLLSDDSDRLIKILEDLEAFYQEHIAIEENEIFPLAKTVLDKNEIELIAKEMVHRRGISFPKGVNADE
jgi:hemerythrin-like domain-containing protein